MRSALLGTSLVDLETLRSSIRRSLETVVSCKNTSPSLCRQAPGRLLHSARRGDYRISYRITDVVTMAAIEHRADAYR